MAEENSTTPDTSPPPEAARVAELEGEVASLKDRHLRTLAEMENLRRRTDRDVADARQYSVAAFARDMLVVGDNLRRAIEAVPAEAAKADPALSALIEGVQVTERGLEQSLQKFGVRRVDTKGEKFDPAFHQAIYELETDTVPPGTVAEAIQAGYVIGERMLRPALVAVAKAPAKPAVAVPQETADEAVADAGGDD